MTGPCAGQEVFLSRVKIITNEGDLGFVLERTQFPVRLAFAMTIKKSQGQSLQNVGIDLRTPVFGHGQLYVALSRGTNWQRIKILLKDTNKTANIVYKDVLLD